MKKRWLCLGLTIVALLGASLSITARPPAEGGPWDNATLAGECSAQSLICAEWPWRDGGSSYCCIEPTDVGSTSYSACVIYLGDRDPDSPML